MHPSSLHLNALQCRVSAVVYATSTATASPLAKTFLIGHINAAQNARRPTEVSVRQGYGARGNVEVYAWTR